ncbi:hypothetical protein BN863_18510 [Formosa agariphila KMM 3901]|uniref:DUF4465 domain-containing protein n=1 Tax=Formosa agariphila (strain DSM 15362 / KCTC 12365 / LMG 23005 / KMM 3901 / M-2Alg 35-1) TaxID=1347342 RepID=T2KM73_FORAG|nr:DUF4465 domain-containing protein [Formosa agariphila]CDF79563.1 hypothetical protein BN863_18510 [Formosa agariphila KMM 3901]
MKFTKKYISITAAIIGLTVFNSCAERYIDEIEYGNDVTFNELTLDRFSFLIPDAPFQAEGYVSGEITVNVSKNADGTYSGFALSNKNSRSYPWSLSPTFAPASELSPAEVQTSIDSTFYSVYTDEVNRTENFLVGNTNNDDAYFTLPTPNVIEHVLVANTSYNALLSLYGSIYSGDIDAETQMYDINGDVVANPNIANTDDSVKGVFTLPGVDGTLNTVRLSAHQTLQKMAAGEAAGEEAGQAIGGESVGIAAGEAAGEAARDQYVADNPSSTEEEQQAAYDAAYQEAYDAAYGDVYQAAYNEAYDQINIGDITLTIEGFLNGTSVGTTDVYLALLEGVDPANPAYTYTVTDWRRVDLSSFGAVDKVLFKMSSSYVNPDGSMVYAPTFCLDGIRLQ